MSKRTPRRSRLPGANSMPFRVRSTHAPGLEAEKYLFHACDHKIMRPIVLRAGVIYGKGVKLIEAAHWLMSKRLLAVWREPTWIDLLALPDFLDLVRTAIENQHLFGIYNLCDDQPLLVQNFLDRLAVHWGIPSHGGYLGALFTPRPCSVNRLLRSSVLRRRSPVILSAW